MEELIDALQCMSEEDSGFEKKNITEKIWK
jgi:hypothetical protein